MNQATSLACILALFSATPASAQDKRAAPSPSAKNLPASVTAISPIFGQLVMFSQPSTFKIVHEATGASNYIREAVLSGETVAKWSQMITITGYKGLAANPRATPRAFVDSIAGGFAKACPGSFSSLVIGDTKVSGHDAFAAVAACGTVNQNNSTHSETSLLIGIKGSQDLYSLQWAERATPSNQAQALSAEKWKARLDTLQPLRLCAIVPGEKAPYPNCVNQK